MGLTNTVVLLGKGLKDDVLVLPTRGTFRWIARVETVPAAIYVVKITIGVMAGAHPRACHPDVLHSNGRPRTPVEDLAKGCLRLLSVSCSLCRCFTLKRSMENTEPAVVKNSTLYRIFLRHPRSCEWSSSRHRILTAAPVLVRC